MPFTPSLPIELWLQILQLAASSSSSYLGSNYTPFEVPGTLFTFDADLQAKRSIVSVCKLWKALATHMLYEDVIIRHGSSQLKDRLASADVAAPQEAELEAYGTFVRRMVLPYSHTATARPLHMSALDILQECPRLETLVRPPHRELFSNLLWEFPAPCVPLDGLKRLDWWHYNDAARTGGINSFQDVLHRTPNLRYLSIGGDLWITFTGGSSAVNLPELTTLRLCRMNMLFIPMLCRWYLPSLTNIIVGDISRGMDNLWDTFGPNVQLVEFGAHLRFIVEDHLTTTLSKCPQLKHLNYYAMFMAKCAFGGIHPSIHSIGLHARPCSFFEIGDDSTAQQLDAHMTLISGPAFPGLRQITLYGDWRPFQDTSQLLVMQKSVSSRGITVIFEEDF